MIRRLVLLAVGGWSPSRIMLLEGQRFGDDCAAGFLEGLGEPAPAPKPRKLSLLDRWEQWNFRRDPTALARMAGPPLPDDPELRANLRAMAGDHSEYDRLQADREREPPTPPAAPAA